VKREIILTNDGSTTIHISDLNECYHSRFGAIQEAKHVFIKNGLDLFRDVLELAILEIGFGTGLNAFITYLETIGSQKINYHGVEAYPISTQEMESLNYVSSLNAVDYSAVFKTMHLSKWEEIIPIAPHFSLIKRKQFIQDISDQNQFNLIYFDAFGFTVQPELWTENIFKSMYEALKPEGVLVTYACRTPIKRAMLSAGFKIEKLAGPPGKREMLRGTK